MDLGTATSTQSAKTYEPSVKNDKSTAKNEAASYAPEEKDAKGISDTLELSEAVQDKKETDEKSIVGNGFKDFDMDAFQGEVRSTLLASINASKETLRAAGVEFAKFNEDTLKYDLSELEKNGEIQEAEVPEYWNSENTAQRIFDFAMSFRSLAPELSDEEYISQVRSAVEDGFKLAKRDLGDLPGQSAKLFNNTYDKAMSKFDELLAQMQQKKTESTVNSAVQNAVGA